MKSSTTHGIRIEMAAHYEDTRSSPTDELYFFAYHVRITNMREESVQVLSRRWTVTNGAGEAQEVDGPGMAGRQPVIAPLSTYEYTSFCPLPTPVGAVQGAYLLKTEAGEHIDAVIEPCTLAVPSMLH